jgi:hypothetical protein
MTAEKWRLFGCGVMVGAGLVAALMFSTVRYRLIPALEASQKNTVESYQRTIGGWQKLASTCLAERIAERADQSQWATALYEPVPASASNALAVAILANLLRLPLGRLPVPASGPAPRWIVPGRVKPLVLDRPAAVGPEGIRYYWIDAKTQQVVGPYFPEAVR